MEEVYLRVDLDTNDDDAGGGADATFDLTDVSGVSQVWADRVVSDSNDDTLTVDNLSLDTTVGVRGGADATRAVLVYDFDGTTGTSDSATLALDGGVAQDVTIDGVESIAISVTGETASDLAALTASTLETLTVSGSANLTISDVDGDGDDVITTIDASDATGDVNVAGINAAIETVNGGSGDDVFGFSANLDEDVTVNGGDGADRVAVTADDITLSDLDLSSVEAVEVDGNAAADTIDFADTTLNAIVDAANAETLSNLGVSASVTLTGTAAGATTVGYDGVADPGSTSDEVTITLGDAVNDAAYDGGTNALTVDGVETLNFVSSIGANDLGDLDGDAAETVTFTGEENVSADFLAAMAALDNVDASGLTGDATANLDLSAVANATRVTVKGTGNDDTIVVDSGNANENHDIEGGAGADTITLTDATAAGNARVVYNSTSDGGAALSADLAAGDVISFFGTAANAASDDDVVISGELADSLEGNGSVADNVAAGAVNLDGGDGIFIMADDGLDIAGGDNINFTEVQADIGALSNETVGDAAIFVLTDDADDDAAIYGFNSVTADDEVTQDEIQLLGSVVSGDGDFAANDIEAI
ncbi:beta strand repeat-containing protein [Spiribacter salinus]|uniref:beta strand repeat-containing protein n=1 Tax=Spiribacter salinus TaxID=1335746 RepID=UPI001C978A05|nr:calcium-binding protein [Spiribacter salinus]MBY5269201.1 hypothetical protein [Spiribacter salinus]